MTFEEYPKFLPEQGVVVQDAKQEKAVKSGKAQIKETVRSEGTDREVVGTKGKKSKAKKIAVKKSARKK